MIKKCTKCGIDKKISEFRKDKSKRDGLYSSCNDCHRQRLGIKQMIPAKTDICKLCLIEFKPRVNQLNNKRGFIFCSRKCEMEFERPNRKTQYSGYRKYILARDNGKCVITGDTENLDIHHIKTRGSGGTNEYNNLITISRKIHQLAHGIDAQEFKKIFEEYTSKFERPFFWDEVMEKSDIESDNYKKYKRTSVKKYVNSIKGSEKYKNYVENRKIKDKERHINYKEKYGLGYSSVKRKKALGLPIEKISLGKNIVQYTKDNTFIREYISMKEAENKTGIGKSHICMCCQGKEKSAGGYIWKYKD